MVRRVYVATVVEYNCSSMDPHARTHTYTHYSTTYTTRTYSYCSILLASLSLASVATGNRSSNVQSYVVGT